jgi:hypothetical protein
MEISLGGQTEINVGTDQAGNKAIICIDAASGIRIIIPLAPGSAKLIGEALLKEHIVIAKKIP